MRLEAETPFKCCDVKSAPFPMSRARGEVAEDVAQVVDEIARHLRLRQLSVRVEHHAIKATFAEVIRKRAQIDVRLRRRRIGFCRDAFHRTNRGQLECGRIRPWQSAMDLCQVLLRRQRADISEDEAELSRELREVPQCACACSDGAISSQDTAPTS